MAFEQSRIKVQPKTYRVVINLVLDQEDAEIFEDERLRLGLTRTNLTRLALKQYFASK